MACHMPPHKLPFTPILLFSTPCRRTQRYEAHIWSDKKQIYLGSYCRREQAAVAHDIMALKVKGPHAAELNFPNYDYACFLPLVLNFAQVRREFFNGSKTIEDSVLHAFSGDNHPLSPKP